MAELFQTTVPNINMHIKNIFEESELNPDSVIKDFLITADDGKKYRTKFYSLDIIISVGYRIKFNDWAESSGILTEEKGAEEWVRKLEQQLFLRTGEHSPMCSAY